ncbi:hypothetical protein Syun_028142 [Stephania yunnanensis]|uniref:Uncharacterized protein n=1 Tax=Stephania yunnanensis TaxID=152371 RepID=A0AAP0EGT1_9MAGN
MHPSAPFFQCTRYAPDGNNTLGSNNYLISLLVPNRLHQLTTIFFIIQLQEHVHFSEQKT